MFSRRFRSRLRSMEQLFNPLVQTFLQRVFHKALATTTNIDNCFAAIGRWLSTCWRTPSITLLAAHHCRIHAKRAHAKWRNKRLKATQGRENARRPIWTMAKRKRGLGNRASAYNMFMAEQLMKLHVEESRDALETRKMFKYRVFA